MIHPFAQSLLEIDFFNKNHNLNSASPPLYRQAYYDLLLLS